jgi:cell division protease FtsH
MVCEWGMSDKLGPLSYGAKEEEIFLGREIQKHRDYSEKTAIEIDEEISKIVKNGVERAEKILKDNMDILHKLSKELLEREILDGHEIDTIIKGEELPPIPENGKDEASTKSEESAGEVPKHVKEMIEKRKNKDTTPKDDSN